MDHHLNIRELDVSPLAWLRSEIHEWQFSLFIMLLTEKITIFCVVSHEIVKITGIMSELDFTIKTESETWYREILKTAFLNEFIYPSPVF